LKPYAMQIALPSHRWCERPWCRHVSWSIQNFQWIFKAALVVWSEPLANQQAR
jgi:hypothetical protein